MNLRPQIFHQRWQLCRALFISGVVAALPLTAQTYTASPIPASSYATDPYYFTGILTAPNRIGSGAVVKSPRVVYSCAHVMFDSDAVDPWLNNVRWYRAWASGNQPSLSGGQPLRGYYYFVGYAAAAKANQDSSESFSMDFVVHYAYQDTANGRYAGYFENGVSALTLPYGNKLITGYPTGLYKLLPDDSRTYLMHSTGPFTRAFSVINGNYLEISEVSTGKGNSGGPVWVNNAPVSPIYSYAGVLVSVLARSTGDSTDRSGVYGVDTSSTALIDAAIGASGGTVTAPSIIAQPTSRRVNAGQTVSFTVAASGASGYRWLFNGIAISGETDETLTLGNVSPAQSGTYQVVVSNTGGETRSTVVTLAVDAAPTIVRDPVSQTVVAGAGATLSVSIESSTAASYLWMRNGVSIAGATSATLVLSNVQLNVAGAYSVVISNSVGSVTSAVATLTVIPISRLANLSVRTRMSAEQILIVGVSVGGGTREILVRGAGPTLASFGLSGAMVDPQLDLYNGTIRVFQNLDWPTSLAPTFASVGAFVFPTGSRDAALLQPISGSRSIQVRGTGPGVVLVEAYDTGPVAIARLVNVSARSWVGTGDDILIAGFNIAGSGTKQVLIRAVGPKLATFGVQGFLVDPRIELFSASGTGIGANDNWQPTLSGIFSAVGAFTFDAASRDAALLVTLFPGSYTVQVRGADGGTGEALIEIYEVQ